MAACLTLRAWCGAPASGRCSTGSTCRSSGPTVGRGRCAVSCPMLRGCSSAGWRSSTHSALRCWQELAEMPPMSQSRSKPGSKNPSRWQPESGRVTSDLEHVPRVGWIACDVRRSDERRTFLVSRRVTTRSPSRRDQPERSEQVKTIDVLRQARDAFERRDWVHAFDGLQGADDLAPNDTMALATSAYLLGNVDDAVRALQSGYQDRIRNGDSLGAVRFASWLGLPLNVRGETAVGGGWVALAQRPLEDGG